MKHFFRGSAVAVLVLAFSAIRCKSKPKPLTADEVKTFVKEVERSMAKRDATFLDESFDRSEMLGRAGLGKSRNARGFSKGAAESIQFGETIAASMGKNGQYKLVKTYQKDDKWHAIFRFYADEGLNYHDMELIRHDGKAGIADIFIYTTGENFSKTIGSIFRQMEGMMDDMTGEEKWLKSLPEIKKMVLEEKYQDAYDAFEKMPEKVKKGKAFQVMYLQICSGLDMDTYKKALDEFQVNFAAEPNMHLVLIDAFFLNKEYDKALHSVNELDKMIDKDPFLDYYRYLCYNVRDDKANAKKYLLQLTKAMPDFPEGQLELIAAYLEEGDFEAAKPLVTDYQSRKSYDQSTLSNLLLMYPGYNK
jgi:tetratricopeptide (TPR) repeat protein